MTAVKRICSVALGVIAVLAMTGTATAASSWHEMVHRTDRFLTDGHRYAAWADFATPSLSLLDTWTGKRRVVGKPAGCSLPTTFYDPSGLGALAYPRLILWCRRQEPYSRLLDLRTGRSHQYPPTARSYPNGLPPIACAARCRSPIAGPSDTTSTKAPGSR